MRKNVLISILAMTSASSMTAYANANLDKINTDDKAEWEGATSDVTLENGVIVSTDGTPIEQAIGSLLPGDYKVTATLDNAKILINGKALDADNQFHLDAATNVTVRIEAVTADKQYQVAGLALELVYNFSETNKLLVDRLVEVTNKIYDDETGATLLEESSQIAAKIAKLVDDQPGAYEAYKLYEEYELYKGVENSTITAEINRFSLSFFMNIPPDILRRATRPFERAGPRPPFSPVTYHKKGQPPQLSSKHRVTVLKPYG